MRTLSIKQLMQKFKVRSKRTASMKGGGSSHTNPSYEEPLTALLDCWRANKFDYSKSTKEVDTLLKVMSQHSRPTHHHKSTINFHLQQALKQHLEKPS
jgi:hypothetical protein